MPFFKSKTFFIMVLLQLAGPLSVTFGNWCNIIQYVSGFGFAYTLWDYFVNHKQQIRSIEAKLHLIHEHIKEDSSCNP